MTVARDFFYAGGGRREALEAIFEGVRRHDAVMVLVGAAGSGRSALIRQFRDEVDPQVLSLALITGDILMSPDQACSAFVSALGHVGSGNAQQSLWHAISQEHAEGRQIVLIVDDAHELGAETRSTIMMFARDAGVALVLAGDESLAPAMDPEVAFEVVALRPFSEEESEEFVAGWLGVDQEDELPSHRVMARLHRHSAGMPGRLAGLLGGGAAERAVMLPHRLPLWHVLLAGSAIVLLVALLGYMSMVVPGQPPEPVVEVPVQLPGASEATIESGARPPERRGAMVAVPQPLNAKPFVPASAVATESADGMSPLEPASAPDIPPVQAPMVLGVPGAKLTAAPVREQLPAPGAVRYTTDEQVLLGEARTRVTVQFFASFNEQAVAQFQRHHSAIGLRIFRTTREDLPWYVAVAGSYRNRDEARAAILRMPIELQELKPWARTLQSIQDELRRRKD